MSDTVIRIENLSKQYRLGEITGKTLRDEISRWWAKRTGKPNPLAKVDKQHLPTNGKAESIWALKDVSFEVKQGEVLGIIGRNGAGKSTLLKILSRVTSPTSGLVRVRGRIASLLEVGTGFHPELTGRENIFLNGAILGMTKAEVRSKFDEIVAFAEVKKFIDTPVKRYSSGMYVRLAFAVAAHLEPEILIVDEVLAVGDIQFQKKCLGKMKDVAGEGRTVLFVSHNMRAIQTLCGRGLFLEAGEVRFFGACQATIDNYLSSISSPPADRLDLRTSLVGRRGNGIARITEFVTLTKGGTPSSQFPMGEPIRARMKITASKRISDPIFGFSFVAADGTEIFGTSAHDGGIEGSLEAGEQTFECLVDPMHLTPGRYSVRAAIFKQGASIDHVDALCTFDVLNVGVENTLVPSNHYVGYTYFPFEWKRLQHAN